MVGLLHAFFAAAPLAAIALALALGYLLGKLCVGTFVLGPVAATLLVAIAFGQVGLVFGWLRARRPTFGQLPAAAALYLKDFGLSVFVACIGLATGPEALRSLLEYGVAIPIAGIAVALVPGFVSLYYGKYVLKMHPVILCGSLCGRQASTPAINAVALAANSNVPVLGYTVPYTVANVLLTLAGPVIVLIV
jgi:putative transport protein